MSSVSKSVQMKNVPRNSRIAVENLANKPVAGSLIAVSKLPTFVTNPSVPFKIVSWLFTFNIINDIIFIIMEEDNDTNIICNNN